MKKTLVFLVLSGLLLFQTSNGVASYLYGIEVGDKIKFTSHTGPNGGGEFTWVADTDNNDIFGGDDYTWKSFCIEKNENISLSDPPYEVKGISGYAMAGGNGGQDALINGTNADSLSNETAWLFWNFSMGTLGTDSYAYTSTNAQEGYLQNIIWYLEGEIDFSTLDQTNKNFYNAWNSDYLASGWTNQGQVQVVNLGIGIQDQLIVGTPVPEPGTMFLLGFGLIGIAGIGRKKLKK